MPVVELVVDATEAELAADALWQGSPSAVAEEVLADGRVRLVADVADPAAVPERWPVRVIDVDPGAADAWREFATAWRAGRRLVVVPAWLERDAGDPEDVVLSIDPGRVFGSASHVSTRQVLAVLEDLDLSGGRVLDVGSGSGVLAIAALRLGAATALAVDVDPAAAAVARENAARNGVADRLEAGDQPVAAVVGRYDLVLANIGVAVLESLAPTLLARTEPGGSLVLAGLLDEQADRTAVAYEPAVEVARVSEQGWTALVLRA